MSDRRSTYSVESLVGILLSSATKVSERAARATRQDARVHSSSASFGCTDESCWYGAMVPTSDQETKVLTSSALPSDYQPTKRAVISWDDAYSKATSALAKLSLADKVGIVSGTGWQAGNCVGNTKAVGSIGYPSLCLQGD